MSPPRVPPRPMRNRDITDAFHERLLAALKSRGMSVDALAREIKMHRAAMFRMVNGTRGPRAETVARIAIALNLDPSYLLCLRDDEAPLRKDPTE